MNTEILVIEDDDLVRQGIVDSPGTKGMECGCSEVL